MYQYFIKHDPIKSVFLKSEFFRKCKVAPDGSKVEFMQK